MKTMLIGLAAMLFAWTSCAWGADSPKPTDPQIAAIVATADQVDIDAGTLALTKTKDPSVKAFAQRMVTDHTDLNKQATELLSRLHVTPQPNDTSKQLQQGGEENLAALKRLSGAAFDKAYIDHEVAYHEAVLHAVDDTLIPSAQNAELKALLVKARPIFESHLEHAKQLASTLSTAAG